MFLAFVQDCPDNVTTPMPVQPPRSSQGGSCLKCMYVHRGSFKQLPLASMVNSLSDHQPLKDKFLAASHISLSAKLGLGRGCLSHSKLIQQTLPMDYH